MIGAGLLGLIELGLRLWLGVVFIWVAVRLTLWVHKNVEPTVAAGGLIATIGVLFLIAEISHRRNENNGGL